LRALVRFLNNILEGASVAIRIPAPGVREADHAALLYGAPSTRSEEPMLSSLKKLVALPAILAVAFTLSGCLKSDQTITVYPDGSGKIHMSNTIGAQFAFAAKSGQMPGAEGGMGGGMGGGPREKPDPFKMIKDGFGDNVYWTNLKAEDGPNGEWMISGTGYFEDINKVETKKDKMSFRKTETGEGYVFEMDNASMNEQLKGGMGGGDEGMSEEQKQQAEMMKQMMKGFLAGFDMRVSVVMPGAVTSAEGMVAGEGRKAAFALGEKEVNELMDGKRQPPKAMKVTSGAADASLEAEIATFKTELAAAKAASEKEAAEKKAGASKPAAPKPATPKPEGEKSSKGGSF